MVKIVEGIFDGLEPKCAKRLTEMVRIDPDMRGTELDQCARDAVQDSMAISLKRIADTLEESLQLAYAIRNNR